MKTRLLLAEDDETLGYLLQEYLQLNDFEVTWAKNGKEALDQFKLLDFAIAIVDVMMPVKNGFALLVDMKTLNAEFPVLLLTSKSLKVDKLKGFRAGADDYILKPVDEDELIARIHAVLRRSGKVNTSDISSFTIGSYQFDFSNQLLHFGDEVVQLSHREAELLRELCINRGRVVDRSKVLKQLWGRNDYFARKSMDVFIYKLRIHLKKDELVRIINIHGKGYLLKVEG